MIEKIVAFIQFVLPNQDWVPSHLASLLPAFLLSCIFLCLVNHVTPRIGSHNLLGAIDVSLAVDVAKTNTRNLENFIW